MPDFSDAFDASAFDGPAAESPEDSPRPDALPGGLKAICIIVIVLGALGTIAAMVTGVGLVLGQQAQAAFAPQQDMGAEMRQIQDQMQEEMNAIAAKYRMPSVGAMLLHLLTALMLLIGGVMTLRRKALGRRILLWGCGLSIVYLVVETILNTLMQLQSLPIYQEYGDDLMAEAARQGGGDAANMPNFLMIAIFVGLGFAVLLSVAKIVFYLISIFYLRRSQVEALMR